MLYRDASGRYSYPGNDGGTPTQNYYRDVAERMNRGEPAPIYRANGTDRGEFDGGDGGD
jgi:hypothetical protein